MQPCAAETEATRRDNSTTPSAESRGMGLWDKNSPPQEDRGVIYKTPSTLFDFNKTWNSLSSSEERWRYISVSHDHFGNFLILQILYLDSRAIHIAEVMSNIAGSLFTRLHSRSDSGRPFCIRRWFRNQRTDVSVFGWFFEGTEVRNRVAVPRQEGEATCEASIRVTGRGAPDWRLEICRVLIWP